MREFAPFNSMTTKQMAAEYSDLTGQNVARFATKQDAIRRLTKAREDFQARVAAKNGTSPVADALNSLPPITICPPKAAKGIKTTATIEAPKAPKAPNAPKAEPFFVTATFDASDTHLEGLLIDNAGQEPEERSEGSLTFATPTEDDASAMRSILTRPGVKVIITEPDEEQPEPKAPKSGSAGTQKPRLLVVCDGTEYKSAAEAFKANGLPMNKLIWARKELKEKGSVIVGETPLTMADRVA